MIGCVWCDGCCMGGRGSQSRCTAAPSNIALLLKPRLRSWAKLTTTTFPHQPTRHSSNRCSQLNLQFRVFQGLTDPLPTRTYLVCSVVTGFRRPQTQALSRPSCLLRTMQSMSGVGLSSDLDSTGSTAPLGGQCHSQCHSTTEAPKVYRADA